METQRMMNDVNVYWSMIAVYFFVGHAEYCAVCICVSRACCSAAAAGYIVHGFLRNKGHAKQPRDHTIQTYTSFCFLSIQNATQIGMHYWQSPEITNQARTSNNIAPQRRRLLCFLGNSCTSRNQPDSAAGFLICDAAVRRLLLLMLRRLRLAFCESPQLQVVWQSTNVRTRIRNHIVCCGLERSHEMNADQNQKEQNIPHPVMLE